MRGRQTKMNSISRSLMDRWTWMTLLFIMFVNPIQGSLTTTWDWKNTIDILEELVPIRSNLSGVSIAPGPYSTSPALYFTGDTRNIRLQDSSYAKVMALLQSHNEVTFLASIRQEPLNTGTLFSLSEGFTRFLELQSSGRKDEIRLHYTHMGVPRVEAFTFHLADGAWHRIAVGFSGGVASLYVDCRKIERRFLPTTPDTSVSSEGSKMSLWVGQRGEQHFLFKGAMQDVKLVAGGNGHLAQCPTAEPECPTCGEFHKLQAVVVRLEKALQQLTDKLEEAEERISLLEQCDCPRSCNVNGTSHADGASWQSGCEICSCSRGQVTCRPVQCPVAPCRNPVLGPGDCCPTCLRQCALHGVLYDHGESVSLRHCITCQCRNGSMQCRRLDPELHCPPLPCPASEQFSVPDECCKFCPGVDYCSIRHDCHAHAQCLNLQTTYACHCLPGYTGDGKYCTDIDECTTEGGIEGHLCGNNTICANTPGSYECQCLPGYVRQDNFTCVEHDECATGTHGCSSHAHCENTAGGHRCICMEGYEGDGFNCAPVCDQPCQNGGHCKSPNQCQCRRGFVGPYCELDLDECSLGLHQCNSNSECHNMPGWYTCPCKPGFRAPFQDTLFGSLCQDIDECTEGLHSCHGNSQCINTIGHFECHCPPTDPNCTLACTTPEGIYESGQTWISRQNPCVSCQCHGGVVTCSPVPCECSTTSTGSTSLSNITLPKISNGSRTSSDQCCLQCRTKNEKKCQHQELAHVTYESGQQWIYQCHTCECWRGDIDCWPLECPPVYCNNAVVAPGDCCPRCPDHDPCSPVLDLKSSDKEIEVSTNQGCHYNGKNYTQGSEWATTLDGCTTCKCKEPFCQRLLDRSNNAAPNTNRTGKSAVVLILGAFSYMWWIVNLWSNNGQVKSEPVERQNTSRHPSTIRNWTKEQRKLLVRKLPARKGLQDPTCANRNCPIVITQRGPT